MKSTQEIAEVIATRQGIEIIAKHYLIGQYLAEQQAKPVVMDSKTAAFLEAARNATLTTDGWTL
jgi:uncharacterized integral membrane protein